MRNAGIDDGGLLTHLSEATAGSLSGIGHSTAYIDPDPYRSVHNVGKSLEYQHLSRLAVRYLFETSDALGEEPKLEVEPFTAKASRNDYEVRKATTSLVSVLTIFPRFLGLCEG